MVSKAQQGNLLVIVVDWLRRYKKKMKGKKQKSRPHLRRKRIKNTACDNLWKLLTICDNLWQFVITCDIFFLIEEKKSIYNFKKGRFHNIHVFQAPEVLFFAVPENAQNAGFWHVKIFCLVQIEMKISYTSIQRGKDWRLNFNFNINSL